jgi:hypothetical protein
VRVGEEIFGCCQAPLIRLLPQVLRVSQPIRVMGEEKTASRHNSTSILRTEPIQNDGEVSDEGNIRLSASESTQSKITSRS